MNYASFVTSLAGLMVYTETDPDFVAMIPDAIESAEKRIYRDLDLLDTVSRDSTTLQTTTHNRELSLAPLASRIVVLQDVNIITPSGAGSADLGTRNQLVRTAKEYIDAVYNSSATVAVPQFFALIDSQTVILGPWPDDAYKVEVIGTIRPAPLSATNTTTILTAYFADLFLVAAMIYASGWMRNYGSQADDPQMAASWLTQYKDLLGSAGIEEARKKAIGGG